MHHGSELAAVGVLALALGAGAALRALARRVPLPYTVSMTLVGLALGLGLRHLAGVEADAHEGTLALLAGGHFVSTDLIVFVFLPALIFESAFSLEVHAFRRQLGFIAILALPAMVLAALATAGAMVVLTASSWSWGWPAALVFGALISATDPVAVIALLREVGAPKRLALLIEGESLLNDGTAIVLFGVLVVGLGGEAVRFDLPWLGDTLLELVRVAGGGVVLGALFGWLTAAWLGRVFDDPLAESTLTIVLAYAAMVIAEGLLHVSGVLTLVTAGLYLAGPGRTRITPQVMHFLHAFWEMLAYIANTVIFFLVGLVIAAKLGVAGLATLALVPLAWLTIVLIRFALVFGARPVGNALSDTPLDGRAALVMAWGGLRGAVSLALALLVESLPSVPEPLGAQILALTTGVVLLTLLVNGSATGALLRRLGLTTPGPVEQLASARDEATLLGAFDRRLGRAKRELRTLDWRGVDEALATRQEELARELPRARAAFDAAGEDVRRRGLWREAIELERSHYRRAFDEGTLDARALGRLDAILDAHEDALERDPRAIPSSRIERRRPLGSAGSVARSMGLGGLARDELIVRYDQARGVAHAATELRHRPAREGAPRIDGEIRDAYARFEREARATLEDFRVNLPEVAAEIERRLATTVAIGLEESVSAELAREGQLTRGGRARITARLHRGRKALYFTRAHAALPETAELCARTPLFAELEPALVEQLAVLTEEIALERGQELFREGDRGDAMYIVARGAIEIVRERGGVETSIATLGGGDLLGEIALLADVPRTASARAATAVVLGRIDRDEARALMAEHPTLERRIWEAYGRHVLDNALRGLGVPNATRHPQVEHAELVELVAEVQADTGAHGAVLLAGRVRAAGGTNVWEPGDTIEPLVTLIAVDAEEAPARLMRLGGATGAVHASARADASGGAA